MYCLCHYWNVSLNCRVNTFALCEVGNSNANLSAGDPVDISLWKGNSEILHYRNAVPLRYDFYKGTRRIKLLDSRECCE